MDLILRPTTIAGRPHIRWALQIRDHSCCGETNYSTIARVTDETADAIIEAGAAFYLFSQPHPSDWRAQLAQIEPEAMSAEQLRLEVIRLRAIIAGQSPHGIDQPHGGDSPRA